MSFTELLLMPKKHIKIANKLSNHQLQSNSYHVRYTLIELSILYMSETKNHQSNGKCTSFYNKVKLNFST